MTKQLKILSVLQVLGHPRDSKRISGLQASGFQVSVVSFERDYHSGRLPDCSVEILDKIENRKYLSRLLKIIKSLPRLRKRIRQVDVVYASGQDMAAMAYIAGLGLSRPIVLEVGDIVDMQLSSNIFGKFVRKLEQFFVNRYKLLVVISPGFLDDYYRKWLRVKIPALVIENKLEESFAHRLDAGETLSASNFESGEQRIIRIGYFGLLRDEWSWLVLEKLAAENPDKYEIVLAGMAVNPKDIAQRVLAYNNMIYLGEYKSPEDLSSLYGQVDIVWACYAHIGERDWNLKWGRPNRFFESCFFAKPTFARQGAHFAKDVEKYNIGKVINNHELDDVINQIKSINPDDFILWQKNLKALPTSFYLYTTESDDLARHIVEIIK